MNRHSSPRLALFLSLVGLLAAPPAFARAQESIELLDDPTAWVGDARFFRFEDGVLVGECTPELPCKRTTYLLREGIRVTDFELTVRYRLTGGNSGIQFRSTVDRSKDGGGTGHVGVSGYQADLEAGPNWTGMLYEQDGRGIVARRGTRVAYTAGGERLAETVDDAAALMEALLARADEDGWSTYTITAAGPAIRLAVNGLVTSELFDLHPTKARDAGSIAVQLHQGPPMKIEIASMRLRPLTPGEVADVVTEVEAQAPAMLPQPPP